MDKSQRTEKMIKSLLTKPSEKPNFAGPGPSSVLAMIKDFLPQFKASTEDMLADIDGAKDHLMEINEDVNPDKPFIEMVRDKQKMFRT